MKFDLFKWLRFVSFVTLIVGAFLGMAYLFDFPLMIAYAQETVPAPTLSPDAEFLKDVWLQIQSFGGLTFVMKCSTVIMLLVASMKVSFLRPLWTKLGEAQVWVTILLGFLGGLAQAFNGQDKFSWAIVIAYTFAGAGAGYLHDLLDTLKKIPGLGDVYVGIINIIMEVLGGAKVKRAEEQAKAVIAQAK